jgi:acyl carrier protein
MSLTATGELVRVSRSLTPGLVSGIRTLATRLGLPLKAVFFAAHVRAVAEETGTSDVISGLTAHGRDETSGAAQTLGLYLNTLPLRVRAAAPDAATLIRRVAMAEREVLPHRRMPLAEIVALHGGRPLFEASFNFTQFHVYGELLRGGKVKLRELAVFEATDLPLLTQVTVFPESERIDVDIVAQAGAFPRELVERFAVRQRELLEAWATQPAAALAEISIPTGLEVRRPADVKAAIAIDVRAPESATERELAALWSELLGIRIVDATASFFELGGNSLLAVQLVAHVRQRYRVELPLRTLFDEPTLSRLATAVDVAQSAMAPVDESSLRRTTRARVMVSVGPDGELEKE